MRTSSRTGGPSIQILGLRLVSRCSPCGGQGNLIILGLVQRMGVVRNEDGELEFFQPPTTNVKKRKEPPEGGFEVQGGCTLIFDLDDLKLKYAISKPLLDFSKKHECEGGHYFELNKKRILAQIEYQQTELSMHMSDVEQYFGTANDSLFGEPFALLHQKGKHHE